MSTLKVINLLNPSSPATNMVLSAGGNVGIGSATPVYNLDVTGNIRLTSNLVISGTGARITGDFSNATVVNRVMFQTSTVNGNTVLNLIPNGTGTI